MSRKTWGCSSPGRALEWHSRGKGFDRPHLYQKSTSSVRGLSIFLFFLKRLQYLTILWPLRLGRDPPLRYPTHNRPGPLWPARGLALFVLRLQPDGGCAMIKPECGVLPPGKGPSGMEEKRLQGRFRRAVAIIVAAGVLLQIGRASCRERVY